MDINKEQAEEILHLAGLCDAGGCLGSADVTLNLLEAIVIAHPDLLESNIYIYQSVASYNWYLNLSVADQLLPHSERPKRPTGWWKPGVTIEGLF